MCKPQHWRSCTIWRRSPRKKQFNNWNKKKKREPALPHSAAQGRQLDLMWGERERDGGERLRNRNVSVDRNSWAVTTTMGSAEGLAQVHSHPLSHEAAFNLKSFLVWEKGHFIFSFALLRSTKRPRQDIHTLHTSVMPAHPHSPTPPLL